MAEEVDLRRVEVFAVAAMGGVGLPRFVTRELEAHLADPGDPSGHVFTAPKGGPLRVTAFRARAWRPATKAAGLDGLRIHDLRHTAVALWIAAGASPKEVAALAGHASVSFTLDRYGHLYPGSYATLRDRLDALHSTAQERDAEVIDLSSTLVRPQRGRKMDRTARAYPKLNKLPLIITKRRR